MESHIKRIIEECFENGYDETQVVDELYQSELNFNNADKTTGQRVWTEDELRSMVKEVAKNI